MGSGEPTSSDPRVSQLMADINSRAARSRAVARLTPEERKQKETETRINNLPFGGHTTLAQRDAQIRGMKIQSAIASQRTQIPTGEASLIGQPPKRPDR